MAKKRRYKIKKEVVTKFLMEQYKKDPLIKKMIDKALKDQWIRKELMSNKKTAKLLASTINLMSFVSDVELRHYSNDPEYKKIYSMVKKSFFTNTVEPELTKIYKRKVSPVIKKINYFIRKYEKKLYGGKYSQIQLLKHSGRLDKDRIINNIKENYFKHPFYKEIAILKFEKERICKFPFTAEDTKTPGTVSGDPLWSQKHYTLKILKPELYTYVFIYEGKYKNFPLKWLTHLSIPQYRYLYEEYKKGCLHEEVILNEVKPKEYFDRFLEDSQVLLFFRRRKRFVEQIIENHKAGRYASAINLILPLIESFLWVFASYIHKNRKQKIFKRLRLKNFWEFNRRSFKKLVLITKDGKEINNPKVRNLLSNTYLKDYLDGGVVEYFVEELFEERNPILHGNSIDYDTELNSAKKIVCLNNLIKRATDEITNVELPSSRKTKGGKNSKVKRNT